MEARFLHSAAVVEALDIREVRRQLEEPVALPEVQTDTVHLLLRQLLAILQGGLLTLIQVAEAPITVLLALAPVAAALDQRERMEQLRLQQLLMLSQVLVVQQSI
jgi:hypothetical protein